jgi:uncharacterized membrane protein
MGLVGFGALSVAARPWPWWGGYGWPWELLWLGVAVLFWGGLIALLAWAIITANRTRRRSSVPPPDTAMQVLKRRLASGEISQEEYERIRRLLMD